MSKREILLPSYLANNPVWLKLVERLDQVWSTEIDKPIEFLRKLRHNYITTVAAENKIALGTMISFEDFELPERDVLIKTAGLLGMKVSSSNLLTDKDYQRLCRGIAAFWYEKGKFDFIDFIGYTMNIVLDMINLWTRDYATFLEEGDVGIGNPIYRSVSASATFNSSSNVLNIPNIQSYGIKAWDEVTGTNIPANVHVLSVDNGANTVTISDNTTGVGPQTISFRGAWYPTTHVRISYDAAQFINVSIDELINFFYQFANYNLVLVSIDQTIDSAIIDGIPFSPCDMSGATLTTSGDFVAAGVVEGQYILAPGLPNSTQALVVTSGSITMSAPASAPLTAINVVFCDDLKIANVVRVGAIEEREDTAKTSIQIIGCSYLRNTTAVSVPSGGYPGVYAGLSVAGNGIQTGTLVQSLVGNNLVLSLPAALDNVGATLTFI